MKRGQIQVYTGEGKGKTSAAIGAALRARGQGKRVTVVTFHKSAQPESGEFRVLRQSGIDVRHVACVHPAMPAATETPPKAQTLRGECAAALDLVRELFTQGRVDLVVLDEILISVRDGFLPETDVLSLLKDKPRVMDLVLTGRGASQGVMACADLVTEMRQVKHPYEQGVHARGGIEY